MEILRRLDEGIWTVDMPHTLLGASLGARSTIVRLRSGGLFVSSPGPFGDAELRAIRALGKVEALVAPNTFHHLYLGRARDAFPEAAVFLAPGLKEKVPALPAGEVLGDEPSPLWEGVLDQTTVRGIATNEVVFFHAASGTLVLTDLAFNIRSGGPWTRLSMRLNGGFGRFGPTRIMRSAIRDAGAFRQSIEKSLAWDFDRIVVAHGDVIEHGGRKEMARAFGLEAGPRGPDHRPSVTT